MNRQVRQAIFAGLLMTAVFLWALLGCTVHLHTHYHAGLGRDAGATATTQPAARKSFLERLLEDVAE